MRNDKGVRIVMDVKGEGLQVGAGPRGITLSVGEAGGPPADASPRLPQTLGFGELKTGPLYFSPTLNAQVFTAASGNPGFNGKWSFGPVDKANNWFEHSNEVGLNARDPTEPSATAPGVPSPSTRWRARTSRGSRKTSSRSSATTPSSSAPGTRTTRSSTA